MKLTCTEWANIHGSGSLKRAIEEDMAWKEMYYHERTAFEIGYGFEALPKSRVTIGQALAEGDCRATTETCWFARALRHRWNNVGNVSVKYITVTENKCSREGLGIALSPNPDWLPADRILFAIVALHTPVGYVISNPC